MRPSINDLMKRAVAGSYDEKFKKEMSNNIFDKYSQRESFDFDLTNQDYLKGDENPYTYNMGLNENAEDPFNEIRATNQSGVEQLGLGLVRATNKAATEVAKLAPIVYGVGKAIFEDNETSALEDIFNNEGIKALDEMSQKINTDYLPVYVKDSVKNGTLMDNLLSTSFYATEGADGIGFMASMFVPGMILSKFSLGSKLIGGLSKVSKLTKMVEGTEGSVQVLKGLGWSGRAIDSKIAVLTNSMIESGAESKGTQDALNSERLNEIELYKSKGLSQEQAEEVFNQKHPDWDNQVASAMKGDFWMQMPMLLGTGSMMHKAIFGKALDKVEKTVEYGLKGRIGSIAKQWGKATLSEGFIEEAGQSTLENYYTKKAYEGKLGKGLIGDVNIGDLTKEYINTVSSVEGRKAIFLGALMGGPFMSMEARKEHLKGLKDTNSITNGVKSSIDDYNTIKENDIYEKDPKDPAKPLFKRDENDNITNEKVVNREKALEVAKSLKNIEDDDALYDEAIKSDDVELQKFIQNRNILKLIAPAIQNGKLGLQILKEELEQTLKFTDISEADKNSKDENNTNKKLVETILAKAEHLQKQNEKFKDFSPDIIKLDDPRTTKELNEEYLNHLNSKYIETKSLQYDAENNLKELNKKRNNILDELGLDKDLQIEDEVATKKEESSSLLKQVSDKIRETEKEVNKYKKDINELWENKDLINKSFESYINNKEKSQKQTSEENVQKADELELKINQALTDIGDISNSIKLQNYENSIPEELKPYLAQRLAERKLEVNEIEKEEIDKLNEEFKRENENNEAVGEQPNETLTTQISDVENHEQTTEVNLKAEVTNSESQNNSYKNDHISNHRTISKVEKTDESKGVKSGDKISYVNQEWIDYENIPVDKTGTELHFSLNEKGGYNNETKLAVKLMQDILNGVPISTIVAKSKTKSLDNLRQFLADYTPLYLGFKDSQTKAPLDVKLVNQNTQGEIDKNQIFLKQKEVRLQIINHILNGGKLEDISTNITAQMPGVLQIDLNEDGTVPENKVTNLNYFQVNGLVDDQGNLTNKGFHEIRERLSVVADFSNLQNAKGELKPLPTKTESFRPKGEFYMRIPMANGQDFYLKLNSVKIPQTKAEVIYEIYKYRFAPEGVINKGLTLKEVAKTNPDLIELIKTELKQEYDVISKIKNQDDITLKDVIDIIIYDNNASDKVKFNFRGTGIEGQSVLEYGSNTIDNLEELENKKDELIEWITSTKRQNIKMGSPKNIGGINTNSKEYLDYLINNNILNTNAVTFDKEGNSLPTFGGYTNIYWKNLNIKNKVEVKDVVSTKSVQTNNSDILNEGDIIIGIDSNGKESDRITVKAYNGVIKQDGKVFTKVSEIIKYLNESPGNFDNAKYSLKETSKPVQIETKSQSNIEDKKAEIEKRRQEELEKIVNKIFPNTTIKQVVYHATIYDFDKFDSNKLGTTTGNYGFQGKGFYFYKKANDAKTFIDSTLKTNSKVMSVIVNSIHPFTNTKLEAEQISYKYNPDIAMYTGMGNKEKAKKFSNTLEQEGFDSVIDGEELNVFEPEQIHILTSSEVSEINKINSKYDAELAALESENNSEIIRKSQNNSVSLQNNIEFTHQIDGTEENKQVKEMESKIESKQLNLSEDKIMDFVEEDGFGLLIERYSQEKGIKEEDLTTEDYNKIIESNYTKEQIDKICKN